MSYIKRLIEKCTVCDGQTLCKDCEQRCDCVECSEKDEPCYLDCGECEGCIEMEEAMKDADFDYECATGRR